MKMIILLNLLFFLSCFSVVANADYFVRVKLGDKIEFQNEEYNLKDFQKEFENFIINQKKVKDHIYLNFVVEDSVDVFFMKEVKKSIRNHFNYIRVILHSPEGKESIVRLPPNTNDIIDVSKLKKRNMLNIFLSEEGKIYIDSISDKSEFKEDISIYAYHFLRNENKQEDLPEMKLKLVEGIGKVRVASKSIIAFYPSDKAKYIYYVRLYNQLKEVYEQVWNEDANKYFGKDYNHLTQSEKNKIKEITPYVLSEM